MKRRLALVCVLMLLPAAAVRAQQLTMNDPHYQALTSLMGNIGLYQDKKTQSWRIADSFADLKGAKCMKTLDDLAAARRSRFENDRGQVRDARVQARHAHACGSAQVVRARGAPRQDEHVPALGGTG